MTNFQKAHDLVTTPATDDAPQTNECLACGARTEGPILPELPCGGAS